MAEIPVEYASQRKMRERNKLYYRFNHWPIWIFVFFIAPGPLTFDLFEHGFDRRMALWLGAVLVGTGIAGLRGALPVTNLLFLPLAYAGGLFGYTGPDLPHFAAIVSPWLPTRQWSDLIIDFGLGGRIPVHQCAALTGYGCLFAVLALVGYHRDESRQYR